MKKRLYLLMIVVICVSTFGISPQTALAQDETRVPYVPPEDVPYVPGEVIVTLARRFDNNNERAAIAESVASAMSGQILEIRGDDFLMKVDESIDIRAFTAEFQENVRNALPDFGEGIAYSQPNYIFDLPEVGPGDPGDVNPTTPRPNSEEDNVDITELKNRKTTTLLPTYPDDPLLYNTWGWWDSNADVIWQEKATSPIVCLLDSGVDSAHPDLAGMVINGKDIVNNDSIPDDDNGHGTHVAGVIVAKSNNKIGMAGITRGKILAVKVLNSVGAGDSWDIGDGIRLCANNLSVKVINMSFGGYYPDSYIFDALEYAISKGKLVVAAAGNDSSSDFTFPAAWAGAFICEDGTYYPSTVTECSPYNEPYVPNTISHGLISVGSSRSYWSDAYDGFHGGTIDGYLWVDTNGNGIEDVTSDADPDFWYEHFSMWQCSSFFTNFGAWVSIVAPGENITSTVPVSYPFNEQYTWGADPDGDGYDTWDGTSMATPFVSGAAARLWSVAPKVFGTSIVTNADIKNRLISSGYEVMTAVDPNMTEPQWGYDNYYNNYAGEAPHCWPDASDTALNNMAGTRILDLAEVMNRTSIFAYVYNAVNGLPLKGAVVGAYQGTTMISGGLLNSNTSPVVVLPNVPRDKTYDIKVTKAGFTYGAVTVSKLFVPLSYSHLSDPSISVSIPPMGKIDGVIDWIVYNPDASDLDMYVWTPVVSNPNNGGVVGCCLNTSSFVGNGRLVGWPYARWNRDGGTLFDWAGTESITIMPRSGYPSTPIYNLTNADYYDFLVYEFEVGALNENKIYFRLWNGGKIKATVLKTDICDTDGADNVLGNADDERWWEPGYLWKSSFIYWNDAGVGTDSVAYNGGKCGKGDAYNSGGQWPYTAWRTFGPITHP